MDVAWLNNNLTRILKKYIKDQGLYASGSLYRSIDFNCTYNQDKLDIKLSANNYIQWVDNGKVMSGFLDLKETKDIIAEFYASKIDDILK